MRLEQLIIGLALFGFIIFAGTQFITTVNTSYGKNMSTEDFTDVYNTLNDTYDLALTQKNSTLGAEITTSDTFDSALRGSFTAVRQTQQSFSISGDIINAIGNQLGLDARVISFFLTAFLISVVFAIIYLFVRFQPR